MRNLIIAIAAVAALSLNAQPQVTWIEDVYDFGAFDENDGDVVCNFRFVNTGDMPLMVNAVRTSCGCTTSKPPREAIMPGDTASISTTYNPTGRPGRFDKKIYVDLNCVPARHTLTIRGTVIGNANTLRGRYPVDAGALKLRNTMVAFGEVRKGTMKHEFFEVYNATSDTICPQWQNVPAHIRISSVKDCVAPGEQLSYAIMFDASHDTPYGIVSDSIALSFGSERHMIGYVAQVVEDFSRLTPKQLANAPRIQADVNILDFGEFSPTASAVRKFTVTNTGKDPLIIRCIYSGDKGVDVSIDKTKIKSGKKATVTVVVDPAQLPSEILNARVSIIANDPDYPTTIIRLSGLPTNI
ncbi:MAG: DUF1573 domain-containing protein [Muribaculaceae bacterium]|nr:DUF1573 domain-containing protein [Muribaculaceae bacterium]